MFTDVRKAHLFPVCKEKVVVELPVGRVVRLKVALRTEEGRQQLGRVLHREAG